MFKCVKQVTVREVMSAPSYNKAYHEGARVCSSKMFSYQPTMEHGVALCQVTNSY